jgi:hypothetical protein
MYFKRILQKVCYYLRKLIKILFYQNSKTSDINANLAFYTVRLLSIFLILVSQKKSVFCEYEGCPECILPF